jgi:chemosensory pili system protein ChpC
MAELQEVYSQLVPLDGTRLIVPRTAVVEVMGWSAPKEKVADAPDWLLGLLDWQGNKIPLIAFEAACGRAVPGIKSRTRIAVLQAIGGLLEPPVFAVATQGYPYLLRVNANVLKLDDSDEPLAGPVLARVRMANERPLIPDLETVETMIASALGIEAPQPVVEAEEFDPDAMTGAAELLVDDDGALGLDLDETQPDPTAPPDTRVPGELTGLDDTFPAVGEGLDPGDEPEAVELSGGLEIADLIEAEPELPAAAEVPDEYAISLDDLEVGEEDPPA